MKVEPGFGLGFGDSVHCRLIEDVREGGMENMRVDEFAIATVIVHLFAHEQVSRSASEPGIEVGFVGATGNRTVGGFANAPGFEEAVERADANPYSNWDSHLDLNSPDDACRLMRRRPSKASSAEGTRAL